MSPPIRAAQYVRMSTDMQTYSIDQQLEAIGVYAQERGYRIVRTYADHGRSGLTIEGRSGLQRLLTDVHLPDRPFDTLLVYDISRWGRFQDTDEGAYYEHLCRRAGVRIVYCTEAFEDDGSAMASLVKAMKRVMSAEYSRELSLRIVSGQYRSVLNGYHRGGRPGIGFGRVLLDEQGGVICRLERGQAKHLKTDRVALVQGRPEEIALVVRIFEMFVLEGLREAKIAQRLNEGGFTTPSGTAWWESGVRRILQSERNIGIKVHGRVTSRLKTKPQRNPPDRWLVRLDAFPAIVPRDLYDRAQEIIAGRNRSKTEDRLLVELKALWERRGRISRALIIAEPGMSCPKTYVSKFGSLTEAYRRIGYAQKIGPHGPRDQPKCPIEPLLAQLRLVLRAHGRLTRRLINQSQDCPKAYVYEWAFGSLGNAYRQIGYKTRSGKFVEPSEWRRVFIQAQLDGDEKPDGAA